MKRGAFILAFCIAVMGSLVSAQKTAREYSCSVIVDPPATLAPDYNNLFIEGTAPKKAEMYFRIAGQGEWTALHNDRGVIDPFSNFTVRVLYPGTYTGQLIAFPNTLVAECPFTVD